MIVRAAIYPALVGGASFGAWALIQAGFSAPLVAGGLTSLAAVCVALLERVLPYRAVWNVHRSDLLPDALHTIVALAITEGVARGGVLALALWSTAGSQLWPVQWPIPAQVLAALLISEAGGYLAHRLLHATPLLWRFHAVHHSAARLYWLNTSRLHPIDAVFSAAFSLLPLSLLGAPAEVLAIFSVLTSSHLLLQHSNVDTRLGPLSRVIASAEVHRWHHSRVREESDANYGHVLLVFDLLLGTRRVPQDRFPPEDTGQDDLIVPHSWTGQLTAPFRSTATQPNPPPKPSFDPMS